jgi:hypothetical protein
VAESFSYDVFLSHSSTDKPVVRAIAERLRADGLKVWFDEWEIKLGDSIPAKIETGLEQSRVLVLAMSANAFASEWATLESQTFRFRDPLNKERRFIPLRLDDTRIKGSLSQFAYVNWHRENREQEYAKLLKGCRSAPESPFTVKPATSLDEGKPYDCYRAASRSPGSPPGTGRSLSHQSMIQRVFACEFREFRGRNAELRDLERCLLRDPKRAGVVIGAIGGMGKTALANHFLTVCRIDESFDILVGASAKRTAFDISAFDSLEGGLWPTDHAIRTVRDYLVAVAKQLQIKDPGARPDDKLEQEVQAAIDGMRVLFLLDNLETLDETSGALGLLRRLCSPPHHKFLITARKLPDTPGRAGLLRLKSLEPDDARVLVCDLLEDLDRDLAESLSPDSAAVAKILERGGGHPLMLRLLTGKLVSQGEKSIVTRRCPSQPTGENGCDQEFFRFVFDEAMLARLGPIAVDVARVIASHPHGLPEDILAEACQASDPEVTPAAFAEATRRLRRTFCVDREHVDGVPVLSMHALTREFFAGLPNAHE